jgi:hypothetical protein
LESYLWARENHLLFGETNFDANGKCTTRRKRSGYSRDGVIKQIERYCEKFAYSVLTTRWLEDIMASMREICKLYHTYAFVVNERLYDQLGRLLKDDLRFNANANGEYYWTNNGGSKIKVELIMTVILSKGIQLYSWSTKSCLMNILTQDTVSVSTWVLIKQLQTLVSQCLH